jgi:hypothetical protein
LAHPQLDELTHITQSTFVKGRYIPDNFKYVQSTAKLLHQRQHPSLLLKVDISWAFDTVSWPFLFEVMQHMGLPDAWRN